MWFYLAVLAIDALSIWQNGLIMGCILFAGFYLPVLIVGKIIFDLTVKNT